MSSSTLSKARARPTSNPVPRKLMALARRTGHGFDPDEAAQAVEAARPHYRDGALTLEAVDAAGRALGPEYADLDGLALRYAQAEALAILLEEGPQ